MIRSIALLTALLIFCPTGNDPQTPYEKSGFLETATWQEAISYYQELEAQSKKIKLKEYGQTDVGKPLHLVIVSGDGTFDPAIIKRQDKRVLMINNAIHPGEPCGVDASMMLARDLVADDALAPLLEHVTVLIIPIYNVGGALNRGCCSRANQVGPVEYGFRGNARNLDLNRDFIKADSRNAKEFTKIFREWDPDVFIDNHTTNGADYPYVMTLIPTQHNKFHPDLAGYMNEQLSPFLYEKMKEAEFEMCPYVNSVAQIPDSGLADFLDSPRYSTGYTSLFNTISYTTEAHMLKTFEQRVEACYMFMLNMLKAMNRDRVSIGRLRKQAQKEVQSMSEFTVRWKLNEEKFDLLPFKGYQAKFKPSAVSGQERLYYDRNSPWEKEIRHFRYYEPEITVQSPLAYIIPQAWGEVADRLKMNGVTVKHLSEDAVLRVEAYYLEKYETFKFPYEGHYPHFNTEALRVDKEMQFYTGDYVVFVNQSANRYIVETLEPEAHDSYFNWNFFDEVLFRKEYFSPYVFEETAAKMLSEDPELKGELQAAVEKDSSLASSARAQLDFVYRRSKYFEDVFQRYPVARWMGKGRLPVN